MDHKLGAEPVNARHIAKTTARTRTERPIFNVEMSVGFLKKFELKYLPLFQGNAGNILLFQMIS